MIYQSSNVQQDHTARFGDLRSLNVKMDNADSPQGVVYLGTEWASNPVVRSDIVVSHFLDSVGGYRHKERRDKLLSLLDVDLDWYVTLQSALPPPYQVPGPWLGSLSHGAEMTYRHMHQISDGERRRVQLCMGLMGEWDVLLLDEVCQIPIKAFARSRIQ